MSLSSNHLAWVNGLGTRVLPAERKEHHRETYVTFQLKTANSLSFTIFREELPM
jgi:hypothetical protein